MYKMDHFSISQKWKKNKQLAIKRTKLAVLLSWPKETVLVTQSEVFFFQIFLSRLTNNLRFLWIKTVTFSMFSEHLGAKWKGTWLIWSYQKLLNLVYGADGEALLESSLQKKQMSKASFKKQIKTKQKKTENHNKNK